MELQITWFFLWALLWAIFFITDGFDFGIGTLLPFLGKTETEKRVMMHSMGPFWDGNEVWLIAAGGVTFAAFPALYAAMFSSFYAPLMLILFALILRGVAMEFRHQSPDPTWLMMWDACIFLGSALPAFLFGVAFANIFKGVPIDGTGVYQGTLYGLLNIYGIAGGLLFLTLFIQHGLLWLTIKTEGSLQERSACLAHGVWWISLTIAILFLIATKLYTPLYDNYYANPVLFLLPLIVVAAFLQVKYFLMQKTYFKAWFSSAIIIGGCTFFGIIGMFPNMLPSNIDPAGSLTALNSSSSPLTLKIMLVVALIFVPIVLAYQIWAYMLFKDQVSEKDVAAEEHY